MEIENELKLYKINRTHISWRDNFGLGSLFFGVKIKEISMIGNVADFHLRPCNIKNNP